MNFIVIGANGGLGSYLIEQFKENANIVIGIDIYEGANADYIINPASNSSTYEVVGDCLKYLDGATTIIVSVAATNRLKGEASCSNIKSEISNYLDINPKILLDVGECLTSTAPKYKDESHLINIGSVLSDHFSNAESPAYGASKAATKSLVRDLGLLLSKSNICVNSISPALMSRNHKTHEFLSTQLKAYDPYCSPTSYADVYKLIHFISHSGIKSLRGKDIVLDHGLESIESFDLLFSRRSN